MRVPERRPPSRTLCRDRAPVRRRSRRHRADPIFLGGECADRPGWRGELAGNYGGVGANASVGVGGGGNFLVGGPANAYALQPISVQGQTGLNVAAGVAGIELEPVRVRDMAGGTITGTIIIITAEMPQG